MDENEGGLQDDHEDSDSAQSIEEILSIIQEAGKAGEGLKVGGSIVGGSMDLDEIEADGDMDDIETSGDYVCAV
jgi:serine/threonine-protein kinase SRK2